MNLEQITTRLTKLVKRIGGGTDEKGHHIPGINDWIRKNPETDPNAYEIMDCNIQFAECLADLKAYYVSTGDIPSDLDEQELMATVTFLAALHPEVEDCYRELGTMDILRNIAEHPFFTTKEANEMYCSIKACQDNVDYIAPPDEALRRIKRELLCKSMSVPFYIWQVKRTDTVYQYDNKTEFDSMKEMLALYETSESPCQFKEPLTNLFTTIEKDYKYSTPPVLEQPPQKEKK